MDLNGAAEVLAERARKVHAHACGLTFCIAHLKGRIGEFHPDDEFVRSESGKGEGDEVEEDAHRGFHVPYSFSKSRKPRSFEY